ncbi:hypothetical protein EGH22_00180 [Halomicroarcula sp. F28]|uniref:phage/plasmid primase, P4 family n=1 Tax=Haloarcula salinisoli TaxID=2487746 RepID=UPI001C72D0A3|nr:phage/plasmid primase, P4 family [Halomicroarcula salinisoli]MBX0284733.1 hypothetical protein [Halomicroarcula salinisoli]
MSQMEQPSPTTPEEGGALVESNRGEEQLVEELKSRENWVCWSLERRDGDLTKVPYNAEDGGYAKSNNSDTWTDYETAQRMAEMNPDMDGIGFMFSEDDLVMGVDLDDVFDPDTGEIEDWALEVIEELDSYTEFSPSGTGFHTLCYGILEDGAWNKKKDIESSLERFEEDEIEMYHETRFFTMTFNHVEDTPTELTQRNDEIQELQDRFSDDEEQDESEVETTSGSTEDLDLDDKEVIRIAKHSENSQNFEKLWNGDISGHDNDHSRADMALLCHLAFFTQKDRAQMERLFEQSGLVRDKWRNRPDYREMSIDAAIEKTSKVFEPEDEEPDDKTKNYIDENWSEEVANLVLGALYNIDRDDLKSVLWSDFIDSEDSEEQWKPDYRKAELGDEPLVRNVESGVWHDDEIEAEFSTLKLFAAERDRIETPAKELDQETAEKTYKNLRSKVDCELPEWELEKMDYDTAPSWEQLIEMYSDSDYDEGEVNHAVVERLRQETSWLDVIEQDEMYVYKDGVYDPNFEISVNSLMSENLKHKYSRHRKNEVKSMLEGRTETSEDKLGVEEGKVVAENGVIDLESQELHEHDPELLATRKLPCTYNPDAGRPEVFLDYLDDVVMDESAKKKIQEYMGYTLKHWDVDYQKAMAVVGPTNSGKSLFIKAVERLHADDAMLSLTPQDMADSDFMASNLADTWVNTRNDIPSSMISNVSKIKEIIVGDSVTEDRKHQDAIDFEPAAKHIFAANQLPEARVDDDAFFDRWLLVKMPYSIPPEEQDRDLINKIEDELPELLNWALEGLERLEEQGEFTADRSREDTAELWQKWSSSVKMFKGEMLEKTTDGGDIISKDHLVQVFEKYCEIKGMPSATKQTITKTITAEAGVNHDTYHPEHNSGVYKGIKWSDRGQKLYNHVVHDDEDVSTEDIEEMLSA